MDKSREPMYPRTLPMYPTHVPYPCTHELMYPTPVPYPCTKSCSQALAIPGPTIYLAAAYWSLTTVATIGFGDILPVTNAERAIMLLVQITGVLFFGILLGSITSLLQVSQMQLLCYLAPGHVTPEEYCCTLSHLEAVHAACASLLAFACFVGMLLASFTTMCDRCHTCAKNHRLLCHVEGRPCHTEPAITLQHLLHDKAKFPRSYALGTLGHSI